MTNKLADYSYFALRVFLGIMMLLAGLGKMQDISKVVVMVSSIGFPAPTLFAWLLLLTEIIFGALVIVGYRVKYTVWPLVFVLTVAIFTVIWPAAFKTPLVLWGLSLPVSTSLWFHLIAVAAFAYVSAKWAGIWAINRK